MFFKLEYVDGAKHYLILCGIANHGKLYFHAGDVAHIIGRTNTYNYCAKIASCQFGDVFPNVDSLTTKSWTVEYYALLHYLKAEESRFADKLLKFLRTVFVEQVDDLSGIPRLRPASASSHFACPLIVWIAYYKDVSNLSAALQSLKF